MGNTFVRYGQFHFNRTLRTCKIKIHEKIRTLSTKGVTNQKQAGKSTRNQKYMRKYKSMPSGSDIDPSSEAGGQCELFGKNQFVAEKK